MKSYRKLSKLERMFQRFNNWAYEFADEKLMVAAFLFLVSCIFWFKEMMR